MTILSVPFGELLAFLGSCTNFLVTEASECLVHDVELGGVLHKHSNYVLLENVWSDDAHLSSVHQEGFYIYEIFSFTYIISTYHYTLADCRISRSQMDLYHPKQN